MLGLEVASFEVTVVFAGESHGQEWLGPDSQAGLLLRYSSVQRA